jgi:hypothetical protein
MITVSGTVETKLSPEKAFAFLSEFENTSEWDPAASTRSTWNAPAGDRG